ncbi:MAG TPA: hypothetical protein VN844_15120 [Pyrinomonadaceae bacterium]|nr:hypothetical protein [Pyrinomonadaceae bacterium]
MKLKAIMTVLFLVFIYIFSLKVNVMKVHKLNTEPGQSVHHSPGIVATVAVWH